MWKMILVAVVVLLVLAVVGFSAVEFCSWLNRRKPVKPQRSKKKEFSIAKKAIKRYCHWCTRKCYVTKISAGRSGTIHAEYRSWRKGQKPWDVEPIICDVPLNHEEGTGRLSWLGVDSWHFSFWIGPLGCVHVRHEEKSDD